MDLASHVYSLTSQFPKEELYGLTSQMRRSAVSIPSNIAEGAARHSRKELTQFLHIASGSVAELDPARSRLPNGISSHKHRPGPNRGNQKNATRVTSLSEEATHHPSLITSSTT